MSNALRWKRALRISGAALSLVIYPLAHAQVNVTTQHNDIGRTGQNLNETILTPSNVNTGQFGKLFAQPVDGYIYAQPLYMSGVGIGGVTHNVVFVATEHDSVYAFDADTNANPNSAPLWQASMLSPAHGAVAGATSVPFPANSDIVPEVGITGTPVIDPASGTLYVVSKTVEGSAQVQRLHALDVTSGAEKFGGPVTITASAPGPAPDSVSGIVSFNAKQQNQRPGLLLLNGIVYIGWGSHNDIAPYHGWIMGYNAQTLKQTGAFLLTPNGGGGGIWMSGHGLAADQLDPVNKPFGRMFVATGNGEFNATTPPYTSAMNYGDSHVTFDLTNGNPTISDDFTTNTQASDNTKDLDVGSGGVLILPTQPGAHPRLLVQATKRSVVFLLDRDNLGGYNLTANQAVQELPNALAGGGVFSAPAYWNGNVYFWGQADYLKSFPLINGLLSTTPTKSTETHGFPGSTPSISANGSTAGIVWSINSSNWTTAVLQAHDASNVATTLYSSSTNGSRDAAGPSVKFTVPTIANGKVYVGTSNQVDVYGLLAGRPTPAATPTFSPSAGAYASTQSVTISDATTGASIYYTTDGTTPTTASTLYSGPISVSATVTLQAMAVASGYTNSPTATVTYTIGSTTPVNYPSGFSSAAGLNLVGGATVAGGALALTDTGTGESRTAWYATPVSVQNFTTDFNFQQTSAVADGFTFAIQNAGPNAFGSNGGGLGYQTIPNSVAVKFDIWNNAGEGNNSTGFYTNGAAPTVPAVDLTPSGISLKKGNVMRAHIVYDGTTLTLTLTDTVTNVSFTTSTTLNIPAIVGAATAYVGFTGGTGGAGAIQKILNWTYVIGASAPTAATPTFSPVAGVYASAQSVSISDTTPGASIYYTTDGTAPTTASILYSGPISVSTTKTLQAIAVASGYTNSTTASATYTIGATTTVNYSTGFSSAAGLNLVGGATVSGGALALTDTGPGESRTAWYTTPVNVQNFTTDFNFQQTSAVADGFTFAIQNAGLNAFGNNGGGLGYQTIPTSVAVKFDIWNNAGEGNNSTGFYTNGAAPTVPAVDMTASGVNLQKGNVMRAHITYNGTTLTLTLTDTVTNASFTTSTTLNIPAIVGANTAYVGFTGGTGGAGANQQILNWTYAVVATAATPTFSPVAGTYASAQSVTISDTTPGASIYYTTDGTVPTTASTLYSGPISVSATKTLQAMAVASGYANSATAVATYTISTGAPPVVNYSTGFSSAAGLNLVGGATVSGGALALTDTGTGESRQAWYATPVSVLNFTTDFNFQQTSAVADGFTFAIQNAGPNAWGSNGGGLGYQTIPTSVAVKFDIWNNAGEGNNSTGFYTNGAAPTVPAVDMTASGVNLQKGNVMRAHITYNGTTLALTLTDTVTNASFTTSTTLNIPAIVGANTAYVGFTGGTGGAGVNQQILNWTYQTN